MLTVVFAAMLIWIAWKILAIGFRVAFVVEKILLPVFLVIDLQYTGQVYLTVPILIAIGAVFLISYFAKKQSSENMRRITK